MCSTNSNKPNMGDVQIKRKTTVKPAGKVPTMGTIALTEWDMIVGRGYVPSVYLYKAAAGWTRSAIINTLKDSLATTLAHFYPLAGRIHRTKGGRFELRCDESTWGVQLAEADIGIQMADLGDFSDGKRLQPLIPAVDYEKPMHQEPLLLLQVTFFRCGGLSFGMTASRAAADGLGSLHFLREWARIARGEQMEEEPVHNRGLLRAGEPARSHNYHVEESILPPPPPGMMIPLLLPDPGDEQPRRTPLTETTMFMLPLTNLQLDSLKQSANKDNCSGGIGRCYSRIEALTAHIWRCASKAREQGSKKLNSIGVATDVRRRINPPLPPKYFGNAVIMMTATSSSEDLQSRPLGYACCRIRGAIERATEEYIWRDLDYWKSQDDLRVWRGMRTAGGLNVNPDVVVTSWFRLPVYEVDFGWGKEVHMAPADQIMEGVFMILPGRDPGSALVAACLKPGHVPDFKAYFYGQLSSTLLKQ